MEELKIISSPSSEISSVQRGIFDNNILKVLGVTTTSICLLAGNIHGPVVYEYQQEANIRFVSNSSGFPLGQPESNTYLRQQISFNDVANVLFPTTVQFTEEENLAHLDAIKSFFT